MFAAVRSVGALGSVGYNPIREVQHQAPASRLATTAPQEERTAQAQRIPDHSSPGKQPGRWHFPVSELPRFGGREPRRLPGAASRRLARLRPPCAIRFRLVINQLEELMKTKLCSSIVLICLAASALAQSPAAGPPEDYQVLEQLPNQKIWARTVARTNEFGEVTVTTNSFVELATGISYLESGRWVDSVEEFQIDSNGYALAERGQHRVRISPVLNDAQGAVGLLTPDGLRMRSTILGITLTDRLSGKSMLVADVTNALGQQVAPNTILFSNAFSGFSASVRYVYQKGAFHQEILIPRETRCKAPDRRRLCPGILATGGLDGILRVTGTSRHRPHRAGRRRTLPSAWPCRKRTRTWISG